jgi:hypothetical protein
MREIIYLLATRLNICLKISVMAADYFHVALCAAWQLTAALQ